LDEIGMRAMIQKQDNSIENFDAWMRCVFDHPVTEPAWHKNEEADPWDHSSPVENIALLTRLFEECDRVLHPYSDAQVAQGLDYLTGRDKLDYLVDLRDTEVPLADRLRCIEAMGDLFQRCFAVRCSPHLTCV
jgi:hypothetical protein